MIRYVNKYDSNRSIESVSVYENTRRIGTIEKVPLGWQYAVYGSKARGEVLPSISAVMRSIESE